MKQMMRIVYVNGHFLPARQASISIFDRGLLFGDAVYEVTACLDGRLIDNAAHLERLSRSLDALGIDLPMSLSQIEAIQCRLIADNELTDGIVYVQISRGTGERDFLWPEPITPNIVMFTQSKNLRNPLLADRGARVVTVPDIRWKRRDIKTTGLLAQSLAKAKAKEMGCDDAWLVENGYVTEGSSTNAFIVTAAGKLKTRALTEDILSGITRRAVLGIATRAQLEVEEAAFSVDEAMAAKEAFATGSSYFVLPVVEINSSQIGDGKPGPITNQIRQRYIELASLTV